MVPITHPNAHLPEELNRLHYLFQLRILYLTLHNPNVMHHDKRQNAILKEEQALLEQLHSASTLLATPGVDPSIVVAFVII